MFWIKSNKILAPLSGHFTSKCCKIWKKQHKYRVLAWNSRWRSLICITQSDLMTSLSHGTTDCFFPASVANELSAQHSNTWLLIAVAVWQHTSETLHLPQLHRYSSATRWFMYAVWGYSYVIYVHRQYFLHAVYMCIGSSRFRYLLYRSSSRSIPPRPNTLTLLCTLPRQSLRELSWQNIILPTCHYWHIFPVCLCCKMP